MYEMFWPQTEENTRKTREQKVGELCDKFHDKFSPALPNPFLMLDMFKEESRELKAAYEDYVIDQSPANRYNLVKEWADAQVTLSNIAWFFKINGEEAFNQTHESNMSKVVGVLVERRADGKILKGPNYRPPDLRGL